LIETGEDTQIGGRIKRILPHVAADEAFCLTYGDGVGNVDVSAVIAQHRASGRLATVTAVRPPGRFGAILFEGDKVTGFQEKPRGDGGWINGGFFVCSPKVGDYIDGDDTVWEREPLERLAAEGELSAYFHEGFWQPMDTLRDRRQLEEMWESGRAAWKVW
jgi:glucose-1-phosphate cytidylyltransferase